MFGANPIRKAVHDREHLAIESIFYTIQGEGPFNQQPALFIRLAGCNLACTFCDTQFEEHADHPRPLGDIMEELTTAFSGEQRSLVVLTGGEPLRQDITGLISMLFKSGTKRVQIETAGTLWPDDLEHWMQRGGVTLVCSPKTPSIHPKVRTWCRHWKYVVRASEMSVGDGLPTHGTQAATKELWQNVYRPDWLHLPKRDRERYGFIYVSPMDEYDEAKNRRNQAAAVHACMQFGYRLSLQIHKIIGVE